MPTFARGCGPFPDAVGARRNKPVDPGDQRAIVGLYLALMADASLNLIGSRDRLLIEGRFAEALIFVRAPAALRPRAEDLRVQRTQRCPLRRASVARSGIAASRLRSRKSRRSTWTSALTPPNGAPMRAQAAS